MEKNSVNYWLLGFALILAGYLLLSFTSILGAESLFFVTNLQSLLEQQEAKSIVNFLSNTIQNWQVDLLLQLLGNFYHLNIA